jgi:hypothetical protein
MAKKKIKLKDHLRLMRWADDNFPPIDLSKELPAVLELIREIRTLRMEEKRFLKLRNDLRKLYEKA